MSRCKENLSLSTQAIHFPSSIKNDPCISEPSQTGTREVQTAVLVPVFRDEKLKNQKEKARASTAQNRLVHCTRAYPNWCSQIRRRTFLDHGTLGSRYDDHSRMKSAGSPSHLSYFSALRRVAGGGVVSSCEAERREQKSSNANRAWLAVNLFAISRVIILSKNGAKKGAVGVRC